MSDDRIIHIILTLIFGGACYLIGWHRHKEKVAREKKAEDFRIAIGGKL